MQKQSLSGGNRLQQRRPRRLRFFSRTQAAFGLQMHCSTSLFRCPLY